MNKNRYTYLIAIPVLAVAAFLLFQALRPSAAAKSTQNSLPDTGAQAAGFPAIGIGNLRRYESEQALAFAGRVAPIGMGELRRYEGQQALALTAGYAPTGIGELRRFEGQQASALSGRHAPTGMGELRRYEGQQAAQLAANEVDLTP